MNVKVERIRSRAESMAGGVKLKTCSHRYKTEQYDSVYLVVNYLWHWERVGSLKQRSDVDIFAFFLLISFFLQSEASSTTICDESMGRKKADQKGENFSSRSVTESENE